MVISSADDKEFSATIPEQAAEENAATKNAAAQPNSMVDVDECMKYVLRNGNLDLPLE